jgi:hypothetical protein
MQTVCDGNEKSAESNLGRWLNKLVCAGLLTRERVDDGKLTSNGSYRYTLVRDLGPKVPVVRASSSNVYNPNNDELIPFTGAQ